MRPLIRSATTGPDVDGNVISIFDLLDVWRRCWKVGQIVIEERWRQNSSLYHSCFDFSAVRFFLPEMNFGLSVLYIVVEPVTDFCGYIGFEDTIEQLLMVHIVKCNCQIERDGHCSVSRLYS